MSNNDTATDAPDAPDTEDTADAAEELEKYELLSGYRRKRVCEKLSEMKKTKTKFQRVPVIIIDCDDDEASTIMTTSNVQRNKANLLEKILSCGRMYRAMRHRGKDKKTKETTADISLENHRTENENRLQILTTAQSPGSYATARREQSQNGSGRLAFVHTRR